MDHVPLVRRCYELADQARAKGNHPFGALVVLDGEVIAEGENQVHTGAGHTVAKGQRIDTHVVMHC